MTADWGSSSYRKNISPDYKQNRKDKYAEQTEEEKQAVRDEFAKKNKKLLEEKAKFEKSITKATQEANLDAYSQGLNAVAGLLGENSKVGKAAAIASTTTTSSTLLYGFTANPCPLW